MKRIRIIVAKKMHYPFYQAFVERNKEYFHDQDYRSIWEEAEELGLSITVKDRVEILKQLGSVQHIHWQGIDYFYNVDFDAYWDELSLLLEEKL